MMAGRSSRQVAGRLAALVLSVSIAPASNAFEAFDGRLQLHGFYESTVRALNADYGEDWDVAQWYQVLNLELELDLIQETVGLVDLLSVFVRAEVRYDCIYSHGCGMFRSMNAYGDRSKSLPRRLNNAVRVTHAGRIRVANEPGLPERFSGSNTDPLNNSNQPILSLLYRSPGVDDIAPGESCDLGPVCPFLAGGDGRTVATLSPELGGPPLDTGMRVPLAPREIQSLWPWNDDPFPDLERAGSFGDFRYFAPTALGGTPVSGGPWLPKNFFRSNATLAALANPFDARAGSYALQASSYNSYYQSAQVYIDSPDVDPAITTDDRIAQVVAAATVGEDVNGNFFVTPSEDLNANGLLDPGEDFNGNGFLDYYEDLNANGAGKFNAISDDPGALAARGSGALPYRPVPLYREEGAGTDQAPNGSAARGVFIPSAPLVRRLESGDLTSLESSYNLSESQRAWNRGSSQKDEKELKEAYFDVEMLDNRLWLRIGKQQVVWGKTEFFRTTDQFNPTDAALSSLPTLEESRIALWSARGVYSFYEVGPIDDVRLELAFNFDDYQQIDIGACGEPYALNLTCALTFGGFAHGLFGVGVVGIDEPPSPWQSLQGWEVGARLEWRYDRFSFALTDFYGWDDVPYLQQISAYTRNVDPISGRPREIVSGSLEVRSVTARLDVSLQQRADTQQAGTQPGCVTGDEPACLTPSEALTNASANQQLFAFTCATSVGFTSIDPSACGVNVFGSQGLFSESPDVTLAQGSGLLLSGSPSANYALSYDLTSGAPLPIPDGGLGGFILPFVALRADSSDRFDPSDPTDLRYNPPVNGSTDPCMDESSGATGSAQECGGVGGGVIQMFSPGRREGLGATLSPQQEALLGCGPFWGTQCDDSGIDLLNAEGSVLFQSWAGVEGSVLPALGTDRADITRLWHTNQRNDPGAPCAGGLQDCFLDQPGTRRWFFDPRSNEVSSAILGGRTHAVGPICTTANFGGALYGSAGGSDYANGRQDVLPGCRSKWRNAPTSPEIVNDPIDSDGDGVIDSLQAQNLLSMNFFGADLACAQQIASQGDVSGTACEYLQEFLLGDDRQMLRDTRSWDYVKDGNPDGLGIGTVTALFRAPVAPPDARLGAPPDFFYARPAPFLESYPSYRHCPGDPLFTGFPAAVVALKGGPQFVPCGGGGHPMTGQPLASEMAALSWNFLVLIVDQSVSEQGGLLETERAKTLACTSPGVPTGCKTDYEVARAVYLDPDNCSLVSPELCSAFRTLMGVIGLQRNIRRAGGNSAHGRRTFIWQGGAEVELAYEKRNVLGISMDFAEDITKASFGVEATWIEGNPVAQHDDYDGITKVDRYNLTVSVDRPTFINFLNPNRTFFFNAQFFMEYLSGWEKGIAIEGPWNFLGTFTVSTAYFQDRLAPSVTTVYDVNSQAGALLTGISYRFTVNFSAAVGMSFFYGKPDFVDERLVGLSTPANRSWHDEAHLYKSGREGGLAVLRDRDELWARLRYTF